MNEIFKLLKGDYTVPDEFSVTYSNYLMIESDSTVGRDLMHDTKYRVVHKSSFARYYETEQRNSRPKVIFALITLFLAFLLCIPAGILIADTPIGDQRTGIIVGNQVKYVQKTVKYISLESLGIDESDVNEGEPISLYFDRDGISSVVTKKEETEKSVQLLVILLFLFTSPVVIVFGMKGGSGRFSLDAVARYTYKFEYDGQKIKMERLCAAINEKNQCFKSDLNPLYLEQVLKYKSYKNKFTCVKCKIRTSKGKIVKEKIWVLNDEPLYQKIILYNNRKNDKNKVI